MKLFMLLLRRTLERERVALVHHICVNAKFSAKPSRAFTRIKGGQEFNTIIVVVSLYCTERNYVVRYIQSKQGLLHGVKLKLLEIWSLKGTESH